LSRNNNVNNCTSKTRRTSKKKVEEGSRRRRYDYEGNNDKDMDGRGREGEGGEKDDGTTTIVHDMGNISAYLPAMMTGGMMMTTFPSSQRRILARPLTIFLLWPYCCRPSL
jgi:hypothetical protein